MHLYTPVHHTCSNLYALVYTPVHAPVYTPQHTPISTCTQTCRHTCRHTVRWPSELQDIDLLQSVTCCSVSIRTHKQISFWSSGPTLSGQLTSAWFYRRVNESSEGWKRFWKMDQTHKEFYQPVEEYVIGSEAERAGSDTETVIKWASTVLKHNHQPDRSRVKQNQSSETDHSWSVQQQLSLWWTPPILCVSPRTKINPDGEGGGSTGSQVGAGC